MTSRISPKLRNNYGSRSTHVRSLKGQSSGRVVHLYDNMYSGEHFESRNFIQEIPSTKTYVMHDFSNDFDHIKKTIELRIPEETAKSSSKGFKMGVVLPEVLGGLLLTSLGFYLSRVFGISNLGLFPLVAIVTGVFVIGLSLILIRLLD